jgi:tellurite methyltransferase
VTDWDTRYRAREHVNDEPHPLITGFASTLSPGCALDVACGAGRHAIWFAERGWQVTGVDYSRTAIDILQERCRKNCLRVDAVIANLERHEFMIEPDSYDLIVVCNYLQRDLFPPVKAGTRPGGSVIAIINMVDDDPNVRPMNPAYLLNPGELQAEFDGWALIHSFEGKPAGDQHRRAMAEIIASRPGRS